MEYENQKLIKYIDTQIDGLFQSKMRIVETGDILRIYVFYQKYRYAKKTQISLDLKKYRYVGEITTYWEPEIVGFDEIYMKSSIIGWFAHSGIPALRKASAKSLVWS